MFTINDIYNCAEYYNSNFLQKEYNIITYDGLSIRLLAEKSSFPHLIGIKRERILSNGYSNLNDFVDDLLNRRPISRRIIPATITRSSKIGTKLSGFLSSIAALDEWNTLIILYDPCLNTFHLGSVDFLFSNYDNGYSLGWVENSRTNTIDYTPSTFINESSGSCASKEKYYLNQKFTLIRRIHVLTRNGCEIYKKNNLIGIFRIYKLSVVTKRNGMVFSLSRSHILLRFMSFLAGIKVCN